MENPYSQSRKKINNRLLRAGVRVIIGSRIHRLLLYEVARAFVSGLLRSVVRRIGYRAKKKTYTAVDDDRRELLRILYCVSPIPFTPGQWPRATALRNTTNPDSSFYRTIGIDQLQLTLKKNISLCMSYSIDFRRHIFKIKERNTYISPDENGLEFLPAPCLKGKN